MRGTFLTLVLLLLTYHTFAGRFGHKHKHIVEEEEEEKTKYKAPEPQLVNSAKHSQKVKPEPLSDQVQTPFVAHALEMKNHLHKPKNMRPYI